MQPASWRRLRRGGVAFIIAIIGAAVGMFVGLVSSVVIWNLGWDDTANEEPSISALLLVAVIVVPIATVAGATLASRQFRRGKR